MGEAAAAEPTELEQHQIARPDFLADFPRLVTLLPQSVAKEVVEDGIKTITQGALNGAGAVVALGEFCLIFDMGVEAAFMVVAVAGAALELGIAEASTEELPAGLLDHTKALITIQP